MSGAPNTLAELLCHSYKLAELGSLYDEDGTLTVQLSAFVELRLLEHAPSVDAGGPAQQAEHALAVAAAPANGSSTQPVVAAAQQPEDLGPSSYSQLGPPKPAAVRGHVIAPEGGWASLYQQLQQGGRSWQRSRQEGEPLQARQVARPAAWHPRQGALALRSRYIRRRL